VVLKNLHFSTSVVFVQLVSFPFKLFHTGIRSQYQGPGQMDFEIGRIVVKICCMIWVTGLNFRL